MPRRSSVALFDGACSWYNIVVQVDDRNDDWCMLHIPGSLTAANLLFAFGVGSTFWLWFDGAWVTDDITICTLFGFRRVPVPRHFHIRLYDEDW